ncbi:hypothetical protein CsSME_00013280 [Camellia sinensis var. sinensis]
MDGVGDGTIKLGTLSTRLDRRFNLDPPEVSVLSPVTRQKAAAKQRREMQRKAQEANVSSEEEEEMMRELERKETELMRLQRHKMGIDDFEQLIAIGKGACLAMPCQKYRRDFCNEEIEEIRYA